MVERKMRGTRPTHASVGSARASAVLRELRSLRNPANVAGMARFGFTPRHALGISVTQLRKMARRLGRNHHLAAALWASGIHEARILAGMVDDPQAVTIAQADRWAQAFDSWDVCDQTCLNLFRHTSFGYRKAAAWSRDSREFVRRTGFVLMACLASGDKTADDAKFARFFPLIIAGATDDRKYVKKAVNWALRQIGKRNARFRRRAVSVAKTIFRMGSPAARWLASDALKELTGRSPARS